jgi:DNA-binding NtrC family response regulator
LPSELQPKLLRALEKGEIRPVGSDRPTTVHARIVAATHRALDKDVHAGTFRADLYYRLAVVRLRVPALRERTEDIPLLVRHFLGEAADRVSYAAMQRLMNHPWAGNVRELKNYLIRAQAMTAGDLDSAGPLDSLPSAQVPRPPVDVTQPFKEAKEALVADFERRYWGALLESTGDNLSEAARIAGVHRKSAEYVVQKLGLRNPT